MRTYHMRHMAVLPSLLRTACRVSHVVGCKLKPAIALMVIWLSACRLVLAVIPIIPVLAVIPIINFIGLTIGSVW